MSNQAHGASAPTVFSYQDRQLRVEYDTNGGLLFHVGDLCTILEHSNPSQAVRQHVHEDDLTKREVIDALGRPQMTIFVREPGMWALILGSHAPAARPVKRWVTAEVLPTIRRTGVYADTAQRLTHCTPREIQENLKLAVEAYLKDRTRDEIEQEVQEAKRLLDEALTKVEAGADPLTAVYQDQIYNAWKILWRDATDEYVLNRQRAKLARVSVTFLNRISRTCRREFKENQRHKTALRKDTWWLLCKTRTNCVAKRV